VPDDPRTFLPRALSPRWWALAFALASLLTLLAAPFAISRVVRFQLQVAHAGPCWELRWDAASGTSNGYWIDLDESVGPHGAASFSSSRPAALRYALPAYSLRALSLRWHDSPRAAATVTGVELQTRALGRVVGRETLVPMRVQGATLTATPDGFTLDALDPSGRVGFNLPPTPPVAYASLLLLFLPVAAGLLQLPAVLAALARVLAAGVLPPAPCTPSGVRAWNLAAAAVALGVPLWLLLAMPMYVTGDGTAYVWLAQLVLEHRNFEHLDGWRLPGYAVLILPFLALMRDYLAGVGVLHAALALGSTALVFDFLRRRLAAPWPQVGVILASLDMPAQVWQRTLLAEHAAAFLVVLAAWLTLVLADSLAAPARRRWPAAAACLGLVLAAGCCTRGNIQVFALLLPAVLAGVGWLRGAARRGLLAAGISLGVAVAGVAPLVVHNHRVFGRWSLTVGTDWSRFLWVWDYGEMDWVQSGSLTFAQTRELRARCMGPGISAWGVTDLLQQWNAPAVAPGPHPWSERDARCGLFWRESVARRGAFLPALWAQTFAAHLGATGWLPDRCFADLRRDLYPMMGRDDPPRGTNWFDDIRRFPDSVRPVLERSIKPLEGANHSASARAAGALFTGASWLHHAIAAAFLAGALRARGRRDWPLLGLCLAVVAHAAALALLAFAFNPRYSMPLYGVILTLTLASWLSPGVTRDTTA
jgi:hypothetical protein